MGLLGGVKGNFGIDILCEFDQNWLLDSQTTTPLPLTLRMSEHPRKGGAKKEGEVLQSIFQPIKFKTSQFMVSIPSSFYKYLCKYN